MNEPNQTPIPKTVGPAVLCSLCRKRYAVVSEPSGAKRCYDCTRTFVRAWTKPARNAPCPCGAREPKAAVLERARKGGRTEENLAFLDFALTRHEMKFGTGLPIKFKDCHARQLGNLRGELALLEEGALA